jgi:hypothetical protein
MQDTRLRAFAKPLAIAAIASVAIFFLQHKGWIYHAIPGQGLTWVLVAWTATTIDVRAPGRLVEFSALTAVVAELALLASLVIVAPQLSTAREQLAGFGLGKDIVDYTHEQEPVLVLSTNVASIYPLLMQLDRRGGSRYVFEFPLPILYEGVHAGADGVFPYEIADPTLAAAERQFRADLAADVRRRRPPLVVVAPAGECQACPPGFSLRDYLERTGFVRDVLASYREVPGRTGASLFVSSAAQVSR